MEVVLDGEALLRGDGEEEEVPLQVQLPVLVQGLLQDLGAPEALKTRFHTMDIYEIHSSNIAYWHPKTPKIDMSLCWSQF